mmetsp:Transcript_52406/g.58578  ORF Transcript_52406/g.58578 Transcript_52406/m.58578 type:complete len:137 (+) Transcript_52406:44-454(+)
MEMYSGVRTSSKETRKGGTYYLFLSEFATTSTRDADETRSLTMPTLYRRRIMRCIYRQVSFVVTHPAYATATPMIRENNNKRLNGKWNRKPLDILWPSPAEDDLPLALVLFLVPRLGATHFSKTAVSSHISCANFW